MQDSLIIRKATSKDSKLILKFIKELADFEKLSHEVVATEELILKNIFQEQKAKVVIAELEDKAVGFALFFESFSTFLGKPGLYLEDLYVSPQHRGKGYGTALLKYLAMYVKDHGYGRLEWAVLNWNQEAIDVYEKIGAQPQNEWTTYRLSGQNLETFLISNNSTKTK